MKDRYDNPSHHERMLYYFSYNIISNFDITIDNSQITLVIKSKTTPKQHQRAIDSETTPKKTIVTESKTTPKQN